MLVFWRVMLIFGLCAVALGLRATTEQDPEHVKPDRPERPKAGVILQPNPPDIDSAHLAAVDSYVAAEVARLEQERVEAERAAAEEAARVEAAQRRASPPTIRPGSGAPHSDAWWWGVAICEQGGRNDPYFGYFSWMDGSAAGLTWEEQVAKSNALLIRAGREIGPWAASCVAAGYRASPGG